MPCSTALGVCTMVPSAPRGCICRGAALEQSHRGNLGWKGRLEFMSSNICSKQVESAGSCLFNDDYYSEVSIPYNTPDPHYLQGDDSVVTIQRDFASFIPSNYKLMVIAVADHPII